MDERKMGYDKTRIHVQLLDELIEVLLKFNAKDRLDEIKRNPKTHGQNADTVRFILEVVNKVKQKPLFVYFIFSYFLFYYS
jgi:hypothetical protein